MQCIKKLNDGYKVEILTTTDEDKIIALTSNNAIHSGSFLEPEKKYELYEDYLEICKYFISKNSKQVLILGGGAFSYPKYYLKNEKGIIDVVEINSQLIEAAKQYFYLDEAIESYDKTKTRLKIYNTDAYDYVLKTDKQYSSIFMDVYTDDKVILKFYSEKFIKRIKQILKENGIYIINYFYHEDDINAKDDNIKILRDNFKYVKMLTNSCRYSSKNNKITKDNIIEANIIIVCSDSNINLDKNINCVDLTNIF